MLGKLQMYFRPLREVVRQQNFQRGRGVSECLYWERDILYFYERYSGVVKHMNSGARFYSSRLGMTLGNFLLFCALFSLFEKQA